MGVDLQKDFKELAREFRKASLIEDQYAKQKQFHELMIWGSRAVERVPELAEAVPLCEGLFKDERLLVRWIELVNELCKRHPADLEALKLASKEGCWMYLSPSRTIPSRTTSQFVLFQHLYEELKQMALTDTVDGSPNNIKFRIWVEDIQFRETANICADACELLAREYAGEDQDSREVSSNGNEPTITDAKHQEPFDKSQYLSGREIASKADCDVTTVSRHAQRIDRLGRPDHTDRAGAHYWKKAKAEAWIEWYKNNPKKGGAK